jgi:O-antigen/teichoic acid export membrane protein
MSESTTELSTIDPEQAMKLPPGGRRAGTGLATQVSAIFATRVVILVLTVLTSLVITRLLGTAEERGAYVAVVTLPGMLSAVAMLGLPGAVNYYAGRGASVDSLLRASLIFASAISAAIIVLVWFSLPLLEESVLKGAPDHLARWILVTIPAGMLTSFGGTLLYGRREVKGYNAILLMQSISLLAGAVVLVGVLGLGVDGAVATSIGVNLATVAAITFVLLRLRARDRRGEPASMRGLVGYGAKLYPASVSGYFNYRADNYIIQAMASSKEAAKTNLGLYSWAVTMAEVVFLVPESVAAMLLPRVAGSSPEEASALLARVSRATLLIALLVAVALVPAAFLGVHLILPNYVGCLPAFLAILPGVVALCMAKVMTSYVGGRGRPGRASVAATIALAVNLPLNLTLIPWIGIVGASLSSVVSYSVLAAIMVGLASKMSGQPITALCLPRVEDARFLVAGVGRLWRRLVGGRSAGSGKPS